MLKKQQIAIEKIKKLEEEWEFLDLHISHDEESFAFLWKTESEFEYKLRIFKNRHHQIMLSSSTLVKNDEGEEVKRIQEAIFLDWMPTLVQYAKDLFVKEE